MQTITVTSLALVAVALLGMSAGASNIPQGKDLERAVASAKRPFVLIDQQELDALRKAVKSDGLKRDMYLQPMGEGESKYSGAGVRAIADKWLSTKITIPARGGHGHNFFCDCGTQLELPADLQPRHEYVCPACGKKYSGEKYDAAVRCFAHHEIANAAQYLALVGVIEQDRKYTDKAAAILRDYATVFPGPHTKVREGGIIEQSLNEAMWVVPLAQAYDLIYDSGSLSDADKRLIEDHLFKPVAQGLIQTPTGGNWFSWHLSAVGVIGLAIRDAGMVDYATKAFQGQIANELGEDGLWPESVHCYHFFPLQAFVFFAEASSRAGIDLYHWQAKPGKSLENMFIAPLEYMYPNFQLPAINDGWYASWLPLNLYEAARRQYDDPRLEWVLHEGYGIEAEARKKVLGKSLSGMGGASLYQFVLGPEKPETTSAPVFKSTNYPNFGLCTLRNDHTMLTFHYGRFLGHGHLDKLSFTLYANDELLVQDYGTPGYGSKILHWYQSTAGHNTVVVDGKNQARSQETAFDVFHAGSVAQYAEATNKDCYPGVTQNRRILLLGNTCLVVDDLTSDSAHDFDWLIRSEGQPQVTGDYSPEHTDTAMYPNVAFDRTDHFTDGYRVDWKTARTDLALGMWSGREGGLVGLGKCPAETDTRHVSFLMCREHGRTAKYVAALVPSPRGEAAKITREGSILQVALKDEIDYISVRGPGDQQSAADLTTDGEIAAVRTGAGKVTGAVLIHGTWLKWRGKTLIDLSSKTGCTEIEL